MEADALTVQRADADAREPISARSAQTKVAAAAINSSTKACSEMAADTDATQAAGAGAPQARRGGSRCVSRPGIGAGADAVRAAAGFASAISGVAIAALAATALAACSRGVHRQLRRGVRVPRAAHVRG